MTEATLTRSVPEILAPGRLFIGGEWADAASGATFEVIDPARAEVLTEVAEAGVEDVDRAVRAAREAFCCGSSPSASRSGRTRSRASRP